MECIQQNNIRDDADSKVFDIFRLPFESFPYSSRPSAEGFGVGIQLLILLQHFIELYKCVAASLSYIGRLGLLLGGELLLREEVFNITNDIREALNSIKPNNEYR